MNTIKMSLEKNEVLLKTIAHLMNKSEKILISGRGDKFFMGLIAQFLSDAYYNKIVRVVHPRMLLNYTPEWINNKTLCIFISESGSTKETLDAMKLAKKKHCKTVFLTSSIKKPNSADKIVKAIGGFHSILANLNTLFIYALFEQNKPVLALIRIQATDMPWDIVNLMKNDELQKWCEKTSNALKDKKTKRYFFLGDGPRYAVAKIGARMNEYESYTFKSEGFDQKIPNDPNSVIILLKPRRTQVSKYALKVYEDIKKSFGKRVIEIDPFLFVKPMGVGKKMDILMTPLYVVVLEQLLNKLSEKD